MSDPFLHLLQLQPQAFTQPQIQPQQGQPQQGQPQQGQPQQGQPQQGQPQQGQPQRGQPIQGQFQQGSLQQGSLQQGSLQQGSLQQGSLQQGSLQQGSLQQGSLQQGSLQQGSLQPQQLHHLYPQALLTTPSQQLQLLQQQLQSQPSQLSPLFQASQALQLQQRQQHQQPQQQQQQQQQQHQQPSIISSLSASDLPQVSHIEAGFQNSQDIQPTHSQPSYAPSVLNMDVESDTPQGPTPRASDHTGRAESRRDELNSWLIRECVEQIEKTFRDLKKELSDDLGKQLQNYNNKRQDTLDDVTGDLVRLNRSLGRLSSDVAHIQTNVTATSFEVHSLFEFARRILHDPAHAQLLEQFAQPNEGPENGTGGTDQ